MIIRIVSSAHILVGSTLKLTDLHFMTSIIWCRYIPDLCNLHGLDHVRRVRSV